MRLILVRHGETEHNRGGLTLGRADVPLNERGRAQARAVATSFTRAPAAIYASPLSRAFETAFAIGAATGVDVVMEPDLIEMDVGEMEHLAGAELRDRYPDFLRVWLSNNAADAERCTLLRRILRRVLTDGGALHVDALGSRITRT